MNSTWNREQSVDAVRSGVDGEVLTAGDAGYDDARTGHFPVRLGRPVAVVRPKHVDDVAVVVDAAGVRDFRCSYAVERTAQPATAPAKVCCSTCAR